MSEMYTGGILESDLFGEPSKEAKFDRAQDDYQGYEASLKYIRDHQAPDYDPTDPTRDFANELHLQVAEYFQENFGEDCELRLCTAVKSQMDINHGTDAFFELDIPGRRTLRLTIDATKNPEKDNPKVDYILFVESDDEMDREQYPDRYKNLVDRSARDIIASLKVQMKKQDLHHERRAA